MATFRKRGSSWQAQVRRAGRDPVSRSFPTKDEAARWARVTELAMDGDSLPADGHQPYAIANSDVRTVGDLLTRYEREITPAKRGAERELHKFRVIRRYPISAVRASALTRGALASYRDARAAVVKPATVKRELAIIRHCLEIAMRDWDLGISENPARRVRVVQADECRQRRLTPHEFERLEAALETGKWFLKPAVILAVETGMRRGEILNISDVDRIGNGTLLRVSATKNGTPRTIPVSTKAKDTLDSIHVKGRLLDINVSTFRESWLDLIRRSRITNFRFHDLRHEAISRFFELGLSVPEVALISGHKDVRMLFRYTHLRPEDLAAKMAKLQSLAKLKTD
jgi:integrase